MNTPRHTITPANHVRVVVPVFNRVHCVADAINSIQRQTHRNLEVVVVDDGSTDDTCELIGNLCKKDRRIRLIQQQNRGAASARNTGIKASGDFQYLAFLDSDDLWEPNHLEDSIAALEGHDEIGLVFSKMATRDYSDKWDSNSLSKRDSRYAQAVSISDRSLDDNLHLINSKRALSALLLSEIVPLTPTVVIRRRALGAVLFDVELKVMEDVLMWMMLAANGTNFGFLDSEHGVARYYGDNLTSKITYSDPKQLPRFVSDFEFNRRKRRYCNSLLERRIVRSSIATSAYRLGQAYAEQHMVLSAYRAYLAGLLYRPNLAILRGMMSAILR